MKQNREHGKKKLATRCTSIILALVFVISINTVFNLSTVPISFAEALEVEVIYEEFKFPKFPNPFGHSAIRIGDKVYDVSKEGVGTGKFRIRERNWSTVLNDERGQQRAEISLTDGQIQDLLRSIKVGSEFDYNFITNNCADWVEDKLREAGVNLPDNLIQLPKSTLGQVPKCDPIKQFESEKTENLDLSPPAVPENCVISGVSTDLKPSYTYKYDYGWYSVGKYTSMRGHYYWEDGVVEASGTEKCKCSHTGMWEDRGTITWSGTYQKKDTETTTVSYPCAGGSSVKLKVLLAEPFFNSRADGRNGENPSKDIYVNISSCIFPSDIDTHNITIEFNVSSVVFFVYWLNDESDVDLTLDTPSGIVDPSVASADPSIDYRENTFFEYYGIQSPEPGNWTINIKAVSVPREGLNYTIIVNLVGKTIVEVPAEFNDAYLDYGTDTDGDGLYDYLTIDIGVNVITPGNYNLIGWLCDANGNNIESAINHTHLNIENQAVKLNFDGKTIQKHGIDGPYHLKKLTLSSESSELVDYIFDAYTTRSYNYADFQTKLAEFSGTYSDYGTDIDGDGLYENLTIDVGVKVTTAGDYSINGWLYDVNGNDIAWAINTTHLDIANQIVQLNFDGRSIHKNGVYGPYYLKFLQIHDKARKQIESVLDACTTSMYNYMDFQKPLAEFTGGYADYGIDVDGDGLYEYLTIDVGVNILTAGNYSLRGWLYDANGTEIVWSIDYGLLDVGTHTMHLNFDGETIQTHGVNGPYYLNHLMLSSGENWTFIDYIPEAYTTFAYDYSDFGGIYWTIVEIDIKPGSYPNSINLKSKGKVPVAVLTNGEFDASTVDTTVTHWRFGGRYHLSNGDFDASTVDVSTVVFAGAEPVKWSMEDVDGDGDIDMLFHFKTQELNLDEDSTEATLIGETTDGKYIKGTDSVYIRPKTESEGLYGYLTIDVDGTTVRDYTISGVGFGELRLITFFQDTIPVFSGTYIYELMGINIPSRATNFTITTSDVKNLKLGIKKDDRLWVSQTFTALEGIATASSDLPSPGNYHVKIFGDTAEGASMVDLVLTADYKITASGTFNLTVNNSGFPAGKYTVAAKVLNGDFTDLTLDGIDFKLVKPVWDEINAEFDALIEMVNTADKPSLLDTLESARALKDNALEEYNADNIERAMKKLGEAKRQVESFKKEVRRTKGISWEYKPSFLEKSVVIIEKIDELIGVLDGLPLIP